MKAVEYEQQSLEELTFFCLAFGFHGLAHTHLACVTLKCRGRSIRKKKKKVNKLFLLLSYFPLSCHLQLPADKSCGWNAEEGGGRRELENRQVTSFQKEHREVTSTMKKKNILTSCYICKHIFTLHSPKQWYRRCGLGSEYNGMADLTPPCI